MQSERDGQPAPSRRFAQLFRELVDFRGPDCEAKLFVLLGRERVRSIYDGAEPSFDEFVEIARVLNIPFSAFARFEPGGSPEIELVIGEIIYYGSTLAPSARKELAEALLSTLRTHAGLPDTSTTVLRLIEQLNGS